MLAIFSIVPGAYGANLVPLGMLVPEKFQMGLGLLIPSSWGREPVYLWKAGPASDQGTGAEKVLVCGAVLSAVLA